MVYQLAKKVGSRVSVLGVSSPALKSNVVTSVAKAILISCSANRQPMQFRGPRPKLRNAVAGRLEHASFEKFSGLNASGFG